MTTEEQRESWRSMAAGWDRQRAPLWAATRPVSERMVELLAPRKGETILELAGGSGDTGFLALEQVGSAGRLIESDFVAEIVGSARRRGAELGVDNAEFRVLDAQSLDLPDESVDGVLCRWGYMLTPDPAAALGETRRVLRPGGRVAFAVWGTPEENPWASRVGRTLVAHGLVQPPEPDEPGPFRLGDRQRVQTLVEGAELELVAHEDFPLTFRHESFDAFWESTQDFSRSLKSALADADSDTWRPFARRSRTSSPRSRTAVELALPGVTQIALARRPG